MSDGTSDWENRSIDMAEEIQQAWLRERPGTAVDSIGVITRIWQLAKLLDDDRRETMLRLGMDSATRDLLACLRRAGPPYRLTAGELHRRSLVSAGTITQRVTRAERAGYVRRVGSARDGRTVLVELTDFGRSTTERLVDDLLAHESELLSGLSEKDRSKLGELLRILLTDLGARRAKDSATSD